MNFEKVWFATEDKIKSAKMKITYDDIGSLSLGDNNIHFKGKKQAIDIDKQNINEVSLAEQSSNKIVKIIYGYPSMVIRFVLVWIGVIIMAFILKHPFFIFLSFAYPVGGLGFLRLYSMVLKGKWVLIDSKDADGNINRFYFADGSLLGWAGIFGGTKKIYQLLDAMLNNSSNSVRQ